MSSPSSHGDAHMPDTAMRRRTLSAGSGSGSIDYIRKILLAVDGSENAKMAFDWFLNNIYRDDDYLIIMHCQETPNLPTLKLKSGFVPPVDEWKKILEDQNAKTRKLEEDYEGTCIARKFKYKVKGEAMKKPGEGIIKMSEDEKVDMIVMGTRGVGSVKRALLGSVSDYVMRNTTTPVILVPGLKMKKRRLSELQQTQVMEQN